MSISDVAVHWRGFIKFPFAGSRTLGRLPAGEGINVSCRRIGTLTEQIAIETLYRQPRTPEPGHKIYPYLRRNMTITRSDPVLAMDIT